MELRPEQEIREAVAAAYGEHRRALLLALPDAEVEEIGATAVPGSLTKGDLDILVRVPSRGFEAALETLREHYAIHYPEDWTPGFASFRQEPEGAVPVGVQLVAAGGDDDRMFTGWRDRLLAEPELLERYNAVKRSHAGSDPDAYRAAKAELIERELGL